MTQKDLKHRFDKLTLLKSEPAPISAVSVADNANAFPATLHPDVFAALENADSTKINWKSLLKKNLNRPSLEMKSNLEIMEIQTLISALVTSPVLVTVFSPLVDNHSCLKQFSNYLKQAPVFWAAVVKDSCQLHVRFKGNKTQLWMRKNSVTAVTLQDLRMSLDHEFRNNRSLKTYSSTRQDEWIELTVEIAATSVNYHPKDISV